MLRILQINFTGVGTTGSVLDEDRMLDMDINTSLESTWHDMEKLVALGLVRSIGIRFIYAYKLKEKLILKYYLLDLKIKLKS